tara:strand:+ start:433 stop:1410 length:978 start_codon:yes stop_codon:yes gene_type:complete
MDVSFHRGYAVYNDDNDTSLSIIAPHSGPAFNTANSRDDNSETVAGLCWRKVGGTLIVSNMSRLREWGVDFNRDIPPLDLALGMYDEIVNQNMSDRTALYKEKYGWVARNEEDYYHRLKIYQSFWAAASGFKYVIMVHRAMSRVKSVPSVMDVVTFVERGMKRKTIKEIVNAINTKYYQFLKSIEKTYRQFVLLEQERAISDVITQFGTFRIEKLPMTYRNLFRSDLKKLKTYSQKYVIRRLLNNFTPQTFLGATKHALEKIPTPQVTIENVFDGSLAWGPKRKLFPLKDKIIMEVEPTYFMNRWYPDTTADIIVDIVKMLKQKV